MSVSNSSNNKPSSQLYESLSALIDGEVSELELHRILLESEQDDEVRARWHRYQVASAALKRDYKLDGLVDISSSVRQAIAQIDPSINSDGASWLNGEVLNSAQGSGTSSSNKTGVSAKTAEIKNWRARAGRFAIAASVAALVVVGAQQMNFVAVNNAVAPGQLAEASDSKVPASLVTYSSLQASDTPVAVSAEEVANIPFNMPTDTTPVPMQMVSDGSSFVYRERRQPQLRYQTQDPRVAEYDQIMTEYFNQLIQEHAQHAADNGSSSLLPYARVPEDVDSP